MGLGRLKTVSRTDIESWRASPAGAHPHEVCAGREHGFREKTWVPIMIRKPYGAAQCKFRRWPGQQHTWGEGSVDHNVANPRLLTEQALVHVAGADVELCAFGDLGPSF